MRSIRRTAGAILTAAFVLASCGEGAERASKGSPPATPTSSAASVSSSPAPTCDAAAQTKIELIAKNIHFSAKCLVMPADRDVNVTLENRDHGNHNFSIYTPDDFDHVFTGDLTYGGEKFTYRVPPLEPGVYVFQCDIHPQDMSGPLIVG